MPNIGVLRNVTGRAFGNVTRRWEHTPNQYLQTVNAQVLDTLSGLYRYIWAVVPDVNGDDQVVVGWESWQRPQGHPTLGRPSDAINGPRDTARGRIKIAGEMRYTYVRGPSWCGAKGCWVIDNESGRFGRPGDAQHTRDLLHGAAKLIYLRTAGRHRVLIDELSASDTVRFFQTWQKPFWLGAFSLNLVTPNGGYNSDVV
ncbi:MAG: hypothetical protein KF795_27125 [Labilithrix sp.]|nr:hypothetical protein [Labilithrix sp.]